MTTAVCQDVSTISRCDSCRSHRLDVKVMVTAAEVMMTAVEVKVADVDVMVTAVEFMKLWSQLKKPC